MDNNLIGAQITKFRKAAGLTQEELGRAAGVSTQAVSRWECGGTPDVALLPAIADKLGVTIDALFGREGGVVEDIDGTVDHWLRSLPEGERVSALCRMAWSASRAIMVHRMEAACMPNLDYTESCTVMAGGEKVLLRLAVDMEEGLLFGVGSKEMSFMSVWPRPAAGYAAYFADRDGCRRLFALLARPGCLELMERLHNDLAPHYYVPEVLARQLSLPAAEAAEMLAAMAELHLVKKLDLELETGSISAYVVHENWAFVPFMQFARCLQEKSDAFYLAWDDHDTPEMTRSPDSSLYGRLTQKNVEDAGDRQHTLSTKGETR